MFNDINNQDFSTQNLFSDYKTPFGFNDFTKQLDELFNNQTNQINQSAASDTSMAGKDTAERLASQGITGGSLYNNTVSNSSIPINKNKYNALSQLTNSKAGAYMGAMNAENANKFATTGANQNVLNDNTMNLFRKYGLLGGNLNSQQSNLGNLKNTNWFDDVLAGINTATNVADAATGGKGL